MKETMTIPKFKHEKLLSRIKVVGDCWEWQGATNGRYGRIGINYKTFYTHRASYDLFVGISDLGNVIDHICKNTICCNPDHLREVTHQKNLLENSFSVSYFHSLKTHCPVGHEYSNENTRVSGGSRNCKACDRDRAKKRYHARKKEIYLL